MDELREARLTRQVRSGSVKLPRFELERYASQTMLFPDGMSVDSRIACYRSFESVLAFVLTDPVIREHFPRQHLRVRPVPIVSESAETHGWKRPPGFRDDRMISYSFPSGASDREDELSWTWLADDAILRDRRRLSWNCACLAEVLHRSRLRSQDLQNPPLNPAGRLLLEQRVAVASLRTMEHIAEYFHRQLRREMSSEDHAILAEIASLRNSYYGQIDANLKVLQEASRISTPSQKAPSPSPAAPTPDPPRRLPASPPQGAGSWPSSSP